MLIMHIFQSLNRRILDYPKEQWINYMISTIWIYHSCTLMEKQDHKQVCKDILPSLGTFNLVDTQT